jgi:hypothetical protein
MTIYQILACKNVYYLCLISSLSIKVLLIQATCVLLSFFVLGVILTCCIHVSVRTYIVLGAIWMVLLPTFGKHHSYCSYINKEASDDCTV